MFTNGVDMKEVLQYLNDLHGSHGISFKLTNNGTCLKITGPNLQQFFVKDPNDPNRLVSMIKSLNSTSVEQTDFIIKSLEKKGVSFVTTYKRGWHKFWYLTKSGVFITYGLSGSLAVLRTAGAQSLASVTGAAAFNLNGLMALSFIGNIFIKLIMVYTPDGSVKSGLKVVDKILSFPSVLALFGVNKVIAPIEKLTLGRSYDLSLPGALEVLDAPLDFSFNQTISDLNQWYKGDFIGDLTDAGRDQLRKLLKQQFMNK